MKKILIIGIGALLAAQLSTTAIAQNVRPFAILGNGFIIQGVAVDAQDNIYMSDLLAGVIYKATPFGVVSSFAQIPNLWVSDMAFDANGNLCCCTRTPANGAQQGIYKVSPDGNVSLFSSIPGSTALSGIALDAEGNIYASDEALASTGIWKIDREGNAQVWSSSSLFATATPAGYPVSPFPLGVAANGIALSLDDKTLYVDVTEAGAIVAVPVNKDGSAGTASMLVQDPRLEGADGNALDAHGNLWVSVNIQNQIAMVTPNGEISIIAQNSALNPLLANPTGMAFGRGPHAKGIFIANGAIPPFGTHQGNPSYTGVDFLYVGVEGAITGRQGHQDDQGQHHE